jgi:hypothetical protein
MMDWMCTKRYSPELVSAQWKKDGIEGVSHECMYNFIWECKHTNKRINLPYKNAYKQLKHGKRRRKRGNYKDTRGLIPNRVSIEKRPAIVEKRNRFGDTEVDLIMGKNHKSALLVTVDRATLITTIDKLTGKNSDTITKKIISRMKSFPRTKTLNEDFMKHQLDEEFKQIISEFGNLLRDIIVTIDKYGLKKNHLNKHKKEVGKFYKKVILQEFESDLAISYQKRFIKYKEKLFLFLNHDGIPWNNNNAEHSIKPFAKWRKKISKSLKKKNIEHHLVLLSILQTCKYQGANFFDFLKSGEKSIYEYSEK